MVRSTSYRADDDVRAKCVLDAGRGSLASFMIAVRAQIVIVVWGRSSAPQAVYM
jgi:hypothetical protein